MCYELLKYYTIEKHMKAGDNNKKNAHTDDSQDRYKLSKSWACSDLHSVPQSKEIGRPNSIDSSTLSLFGFESEVRMSQVS